MWLLVQIPSHVASWYFMVIAHSIAVYSTPTYLLRCEAPALTLILTSIASEHIVFVQHIADLHFRIQLPTYINHTYLVIRANSIV